MARRENSNTVKVAVVQAGAVPFDTDACVDKANVVVVIFIICWEKSLVIEADLLDNFGALAE